MKILVVEDDSTVAQTVQALLADQPYAVDMVSNVQQGLALAEAYPYDLILLAIGLPLLDGNSLCQQLRAREIQIPILLLTNQAAGVYVQAGSPGRDGAHALTANTELLTRVQSLLHRGNLKTLSILRWGALSLDPSQLQVSYGEIRLQLLPEEYSLLEVLLRQAPYILNAHTLGEQGWNASNTPGDSTIRTHIKALRKKLNAAGAPGDFIKTVHRQGYQLNPLYENAQVAGQEEITATQQVAELKAVNAELRHTLAQLQAAQAELQQRNQALQAARDGLEQRLAERTAELNRRAAGPILEALRQSQERFRHLVELTPQLVWQADAQGHTYISPQLSEYTGLPLDQFLTFDWQAIIHPDDTDRIHNRWLESLQTGIPYEAEYRLRRADGQYRWHLVRAVPIHNEQGREWFGVSIDIHNRKQLELALHTSEAQVSRILDNAGAAIGEFSIYPDHTYRHGFYSVGCETVFGYSQDEMTRDAHLWLSRVVPADVETVIMPGYEQIFAEKSFTIEYRFRDKTDTIRWISETLVSQWNEASACWQVAVVAIDISDRKQAELALQASEAKNCAIIAALPDLIIRFSAEGVYREIFSTGCKFEVISIDPIGRSMFDVLPAELAEQGYFYLQRALQTGELQVFEQAVHIGDRLQYEEARVVKSGDDEVLFVIRDISEQKQLEVDRKQAELTLKQEIRQAHLLADIAQEIGRSLDLDQVLSRTVERVRDWLASDRVLIYRFRPDWQGDVVMESVDDGWTAIRSTPIFDPCFADQFIQAYRRGHVSVVNDINQPDLDPCYVEMLQQFQVQASLAVPILQGNNLWGLLIAHQCSAPRQWQSTEITLLQRLAIQVGIAGQRSELYEQTRRELAAREQMQTVLEESEERFRTLSTSAPIGICQTNAEGSCIYVNPHWCEISGYSFEECLGDGWLQGIHPDDREMLAAAWARYPQGGSDRLPEFRLLTPTGDIRWISARVATLKSAAGDIIGYVSTDEDITERKQAEQALRESEQRLQAILDYSPAIIYVLDAQNRHLLVNRSYAEQLVATPADLVGKSLHEIWPAEFADLFTAQNQTILETGQLLQIEDTAPLADGLHSYITVKFPLYDATGNPYAICGISTDITAKKNLEAQLYQAQRLESLGTLAGGIAHDLNNILTPILAMAQMLQFTQKGLNAKGLEQLKLIETSAKRGANLVKQILTVARTSQGERTTLDLAALLHEEIEIMQQSLPKSIKIRTAVPPVKANKPALGRILADPTYLHQIILNLCVNARDAMPDGGTLTIAAATVWVDEAMAAQNLDAHVGHYAVVTVADTGTGIDPEVQKRMFDPFFTTKEPGQGTGLGLAMVRGLVEANQGFLQVLSEVGQGTQFKVYFPLLEEEVSEPDQLVPVSTAPPSYHGQRLLVAEDEESVRNMLRSLLESKQYQLLLAQDGVAALEQYHQHQAEIQLVITDIMMPNMDGIALIRHLKGLNPDVKVLALSGVPAHAEMALAVGADYFQTKPFDLETLLSQISALLHPGLAQ
jgi:PAS domain S-box-containing protein